jgi:hypothetical protein
VNIADMDAADLRAFIHEANKPLAEKFNLGWFNNKNRALYKSGAKEKALRNQATLIQKHAEIFAKKPVEKCMAILKAAGGDTNLGRGKKGDSVRRLRFAARMAAL